MRAAVLSSEKLLEITEVSVPSPQAGQALLRVGATGLCGTDVKGYQGKHPRIRLPTILGHEVAGTVEGIGGSNASELLGERVVVEPNVSCGQCRYCRKGNRNVCPDYHVLGESLEYAGGCAEFVVVPTVGIHRVPATMSIVEAAVVQPLAVSYHAVVGRGRVRADEVVLIMGAGAIGLGAMLFAAIEGARVIVVDVREDRLAWARALGADVVINARRQDVLEAVEDSTGGVGADLSLDAVGGAQHESLLTAQQCTAALGRIIVVGGFPSGTLPFPVRELKNREQTLIGSQGHPDSFGPVLELAAQGRLQPAQLVSHTVTLEGMERVLDDMSVGAGDYLKVVVKP